MNIWIAKVGPQPFSASVVASLESFYSKNADAYPVLRRPRVVRHQLTGVDYFSLSSGEEFTSKRYNSVAPNTGVLHAYSGLPLGMSASARDNRWAESLTESSLVDATSSLRGQYALLRAGPMEFECVVDPLGSHKVLYRRTSDGGAYVTNHMWLMRLTGSSGPNPHAVVEWIATGELFGYATEEDQVFTLPENGRLTWSVGDGLTIGQHRSLRDFVAEHATGSHQDLVHRAATDLRETAAHLGKYHRIALSLSGGYDSRLLAAMLGDLDPNGVECFTYPDHPDDLPLAKRVAAAYGFRHTTIDPSRVPSVAEMDAFTRRSGRPFPDYNYVFHCVLEEGVARVLGPALKVRINGIGGDVDKGINKLGSLEKMRLEQAIMVLVETVARREILTDEAWDDLRSRLFGYLSEKYVPLLEGSASPDRLGSMYFHFERFRGLQGYGQSQSALRVSDVYLPFATPTFIGAAFGFPTTALHRGRLGSLHQGLFLALTDDRVRRVPFTAGLPWEDRRLTRFVAKRRTSIRALIYGTFRREKYAWVVHRRFYETNHRAFVKIFEGSDSSSLWKWIRRDAVFNLLRKGPSAEMKDIHSLLRIAPVLAGEVGVEG